MDATIEITGYGRLAADDGAVKVAQTGQRLGSVPGRAVRALESGDLGEFRRLYGRSRKLKLSIERHLGRPCVCLSYGSASLAYLPVPEGLHPRRGDAPGAAARALGLIN